MTMILNTTPVMYITPDERISSMPLGMLITLVPNSSLYTLEHAAKLAHVRDEYEADNLLASITGDIDLLSIPYPISEGFARDELSVEPATLR